MDNTHGINSAADWSDDDQDGDKRQTVSFSWAEFPWPEMLLGTSCLVLGFVLLSAYMGWNWNQ